jgi:hypothetical protein
MFLIPLSAELHNNIKNGDDITKLTKEGGKSLILFLVMMTIVGFAIGLCIKNCRSNENKICDPIPQNIDLKDSTSSKISHNI